MDLTVKGKRSKSLVAEEMEDRVRGTSRILREDILFVLKKIHGIQLNPAYARAYRFPSLIAGVMFQKYLNVNSKSRFTT